jgi:hypothetical protein
MRARKVDQDVRLDVFSDVFGDTGYGLDGGRARREASVPSVSVVSAHDHLLVQIEGAGGVLPVQSLLTSRVVPKGEIPWIWPEDGFVTGWHGETPVSVED